MAEPGTAIVTGAGKRVGAAIATALLADGWSVVAHVRGEQDAVADGAVRVVADLSDTSCAECVFAAAGKLSPVRLLVNNAARFAWDDLASFDAEEFDAHMAVNVRAPLLLTKAFAAVHDAQGDANADSLVVNILDGKLAAPNPDFLSYTVSKQALAGATALAARALASKGVRVNAIAPSLMLCSPGQSERNFAAMHAANPLRRGVEPGDVVAALRYLVAARSVTGQVLTIDGGQHFWSLERDVQFLESR
jgi:NAD(P)-dependent dehydrogenase (short-subunit alcohol dehydrogenase family)